MFQNHELEGRVKQLLSERDKISDELQEKSTQISELESHYQQQFEVLQQSLEEINTEMAAKKKIVSAANESLILKVCLFWYPFNYQQVPHIEGVLVVGNPFSTK